MKSIILAAGRGSRLKGFTEDKPKCLNTINSKSLIEIQTQALTKGGCNPIILVTGYRSEMLNPFGEKRLYNPIWEKTNMVQSLLCAKEEFFDDCIVSYSDILYQPGEVASLIKSPHDITIMYDKNWRQLWEKRFQNPLDDAESFMISNEGKIVDIGRKVTEYQEIQGQYTGLMKFSKTAFQWIQKTVDETNPQILEKMDMTSLIRTLIEKGYPVFGLPLQSNWYEIDTIDDLDLAKKEFQIQN